ncbi:hypothetical protein LX36DRAFT_165499 [Colletotrichum falcatum]|nr:hypothetical protein LX36DRAFT_165499 [Colletotrichum falcatum]
MMKAIREAGETKLQGPICPRSCRVPTGAHHGTAARTDGRISRHVLASRLPLPQGRGSASIFQLPREELLRHGRGVSPGLAPDAAVIGDRVAGMERVSTSRPRPGQWRMATCVSRALQLAGQFHVEEAMIRRRRRPSDTDGEDEEPAEIANVSRPVQITKSTAVEPNRCMRLEDAKDV